MDQQDNASVFPSKSRRSWSIIGFWSLIAVVGLSSVLNNGVFSGGYAQNFTIYLAMIIIVAYAVMITSMKAIGLQPSKGEMVFIPTIILTLIYLSIKLLGVPAAIEEISEEVTQAATLEATTVPLPSIPDITEVAPTDYSSNTSAVVEDVASSSIYNILAAIGLVFVIIAILFLLIRALRQKTDEMPNIQLSNIIKYSKKKEAIEIMKLYIHASFILEKIHGYAPKWYSASKYSNDIDMGQGPPISNYFDRLTVLYELARFSETTVTHEMMREAQDIYLQIETWNEELQRELKEVSE